MHVRTFGPNSGRERALSDRNRGNEAAFIYARNQAEGSKRSTEIFSIVLVTFGSVARLIFCAFIISITGPTGRHPIPRHPAARPDEPKLRQQLRIPKRA